MYILNNARAIKRCHSMKSGTLSLKTIIKELHFLRKTVINETPEKKDLLLLANKLIEKYLILVMIKNIINDL